MRPGTHTRSVPPAPGEPSLLLTLDEAARELRCARRSVERYIAGNILAVVRMGRCVRIERSELVAFIARQRTGQRPGQAQVQVQGQGERRGQAHGTSA